MNPKIIVTLGGIPLSLFALRDTKFISKQHGIPFVIGKTIIFPMYHPSYILRNTDKQYDMLVDFQRLNNLYIKVVDLFHKIK